MRKLAVIESLSLDGVMQAPAAPDEDTSGGFPHGGWQREYVDETLLAAATAGMASTDAYLFGRRTYQSMAAYWPHAPAEDPFTAHLNQTPKYVASTTLGRLDWQNSTLLTGDVPSAVARLKAEPGGTIAVLGSGQLVRTLLAHDLIDEYFLSICPVLLGSGKRLFPAAPGPLRRLRLTGIRTTSTGSVVATYRPA